MYKILLSLAASALRILALIFICALLVYKLYISIRSRYNATVNCWFCNRDTRVPFTERNSWNCPHCDQYNGFNKDGDYNRDIFSQRQCSGNSDKNSSNGSSICANAYYPDAAGVAPPPQTNGLCDQCNEAQRLKIEKLAQFEPKNESRFETELSVYKAQLEQRFRLCSTCETHVNKVLREKKKMVLGSKFLNFIIKGAALLKQPHFNQLAKAQKQRKLKLCARVMALLTILNVCCLLYSLPHARKEQFVSFFGTTLAQPLFVVYSHVLALLRVLRSSFVEMALEQESLGKLMLYARTFGKMLLYSVGLTQLQVQNATLTSCFISIYPYAMLVFSFMHIVVNGLKFSRFMLLLVMWSLYAQGSQLFDAIHSNIFTLLGSIATLLLIASNRSDSLLQTTLNESAAGSFHKMYTDDFSDEETISMLSQQLSVSGNSMSLQSSCNSTLLQRSLNGSGTGQSHSSMRRPPSVLSMDSLRLSSQHGANAHLPPQSYMSHSNRTLSPYYSTNSLDMPLGQTSWRNNYTMSTAPAADVIMNKSFTLPTTWRSTYGGYPMAQPMQSPFSVSSNAVHQRNHARSTTNLLMPSRFSTNNINQPTQQKSDVSAWVASASISNNNIGFTKDVTTSSLLRCDDKLSRTSSQSSGFESQSQLLPPHIDIPAPSPYPLGFQSSNGIGEYGWPSIHQHQQQQQQQRLVQVGMHSPYSTHSETQLGQSAEQSRIKPGDLLRKWIDRSGKEPHQSVD